MRQFYKLVLSTIAAMLVGYGAFAQCPPFDITVGATEVSGSDFVCDGTNVTVQWNDVPGATGYRLRVGNNASYDNLDVSYVVDGGGAGPFQSTFSVPAATNGTFYTYTVDYSMDAGFSLGTAAGASYTDCAANAETFKVSLDPSQPVSATVAAADEDSGTPETVCANEDFDVELTEGTNGAGDLGEYAYRINGGAWVLAGSSATISFTASSGFGSGEGTNDFTVGANLIEFAATDQVCGVNDPIAVDIDLNITIRDIADFTTVNFDADNGNGPLGGAVNAVAEGDIVCFDGSTSPYDQFDLSFVGRFAGAGLAASSLNWSTDSGATVAGFTGVGFNSGDAFDIDGQNLDYAFWLHDTPNNDLCIAIHDTFFVSTTNNPDLGANFLGLAAGGQGSPVAIDATNPIVNICTGEDGYVDISGLTLADIQDVDVTEFSVYDITAAGRIVAPVSAATVIANSNRIDIPTGVIVDGNSLEVRVHDCNGNAVGTYVADSEEWSFSINTPSAAGTTSEFTITREDNTTNVANTDQVCSNELLDLDVIIGDGTLGTNGVLKIWKTTDGGTSYTMVAMGASPLNVVDHAHGTVAATYVAAIVSDCDSVPVALDESITVNVYTASGNLTSFGIAEASLADNLACTSESITLQATPSTLGDDSPVVEFFTSVDNDPLTLGDNMSLGNGAFNVGTSAYELNIMFGNSPVYYFAVLDSECNNSTSPVSNQISNHSASVDPTDLDISATGFGMDDLDADDNNDVDFVDAICAGSTVWFDLTDGTLSDDGSSYYWEVDTGNGWEGLDTNMTGQVSLVINDDLAQVRVRIDGGDCGIVGAYLTSTINVLDATSAPTHVSFEEFDGISTVVIPANTAMCDNSLRFNYNVASYTAEDAPMIEIYNITDATTEVGPVAISMAGAGSIDLPYGNWTLSAMDTYELRFSTSCVAATSVTGSQFIIQDEKASSVNAVALADTSTTMPVADGDFVCEDNGVMVSLVNSGTRGDASNFGPTPTEFVFEMSVDGGVWNEVARGNGANDSIYTVDVDAVILANGGFGNVDDIAVRSYIDGGCDPTGNTATFTINIFNATAGFTTISLNNDNYCADEAADLLVDLVANGATVSADNFTRIVWYSMDDQGLPVKKLKETTLTNAAAITDGSRIRFNTDALPLLASNDAPDTTTTIGVRIESCDTSAFEVRTITVKDLPQNQSAAGAPAVVSASPNAVCAGSSSTLNIINYIIGANGQVTWYDDMVGTTLLGTGPSYTAANITSDTTFYVRIEADCDTTPMLSVNVNLSTVDPTDVTDLDVPAFMCEGDNIVVTASGSTGDGSYIWEVSFDGVVYSSISDGTPGDNMLSYSANNLTYTNGVANVTLRASRTNGCITTTPYGETFEVRQKPDDLTSINPTATEACVNGAAIDIVVAGGAAGFDGAIEWTIEKTGGLDSVVTAWAGMDEVSFDWAMFDGSGEYTISAYYVSGSCGSFMGMPVSTVINVYELPTNDYPNGGDTSVCANSVLDLTVLSSYTAMNQSFSFSGPGVTNNEYDAAAGSFANSAVGGVESLSYMVTENGCSQTFTVDVVVYGIPTITSATTTAASCNTADGTVKITGISGGTAPFEFEADGGMYGWGADSTITGLAGGSHIITAMDDNGCISADYSITIESSTGFSVTGTVENEISCNGEEDGEFSIEVAGGLLPYDYTVTKDGQPFTSANDLTATDYTFSDLGPGVYVATFMDDAGCTQSFTHTFDDPGLIGLTVNDPQDVLCNGEATGSLGGLVATSSNGGPFEYSLNGGTFTSNNEFDNLVAGDYTITVKDGNGCERSFLFPISEPAALTIDTNVVAFDAQGYDVELEAAGGVTPYTYSKGGAFQTSNLFEDLDPGNYTFTVKDDNGCETEIAVFLAPVGIKENTGVFAQSTSHPNPFSNEFTISGVPSDVEIALFDIYGKRVDFVSVIKNGKVTITASNLASGVYFATVRKGADVATFRMVKN